MRPPGLYSITSPPEFYRVNCSEVILKLSIISSHTRGVGGGGGGCLQGNLWYSPPASMASRLASATFKLASKVFIEERDKTFDFIAEILFRFLEFGDLKVSIVKNLQFWRIGDGSKICLARSSKHGGRKAAKENIFNTVLALYNKTFEKTRLAVRRQS